ncbi:hypothetical protein [Chamaesiphon sp. OTE_75_metabat_556]|uniref:hypothetical protein n=1 Tax=Chamaesiphon sp. OTE_75_metabat_556 TaxID=2964692 RepID=UPI00286B2513|nr:hypothetical protein [Chamaesiphon sp. OTE_75_metabat_556]
MIHSQKVKIISKQLPFRHLVVGAVVFWGGSADSLWRLHIPATQPTKPLTTNKKVQIAQTSSARKVAGLTNSQVTGGIDDIDIN